MAVLARPGASLRLALRVGATPADPHFVVLSAVLPPYAPPIRSICSQVPLLISWSIALRRPDPNRTSIGRADAAPALTAVAKKTP